MLKLISTLKGTTAACTYAVSVIEALSVQYLFADRGWDSNNIIDQEKSQGMISIIPPKKNRKEMRE